jgi:hypothetical protein
MSASEPASIAGDSEFNAIPKFASTRGSAFILLPASTTPPEDVGKIE